MVLREKIVALGAFEAAKAAVADFRKYFHIKRLLRRNLPRPLLSGGAGGGLFLFGPSFYAPKIRYSGCHEDIAHAIKKFIPAWMVDMERFFDLVTFNYIYANGDDHLKYFSVIRQGSDLRLAPAYDLLNTSLHVEGDDFGLDGGLSPHLEKSDIYENTGHPCREDFEKFGALIGLPPKRVNRILNRYMFLPELTKTLTTHSFLNEKMKRSYPNFFTLNLFFLTNQHFAFSLHVRCVLQILIFRNGIGLYFNIE